MGPRINRGPTLVLDAEVTRFCSNLTDVSADEDVLVEVDEAAAAMAASPLWPRTGVPTSGVPAIGGDRELAALAAMLSGGDTSDTVPFIGGGVSGSGNVTRGSPSPAAEQVSSRSSSSSEARSRLLKADMLDSVDRFFISLMLDLSSERSDFMDDAFISDEVTCTRCDEDDDVDVEMRLLEEEVEAEADVEICGPVPIAGR